MSQYMLPHHVFVCHEGEHVVFLDVQQDRYFALERGLFRGLDKLVRGWPAIGGPGDPRPDLVRLLLSKGLLVPGDRAGKAAAPISCAEPVDELTAESWGESVRIRPIHVIHFCRAVLAAKLSLRLCRFQTTVRRATKDVARRARRVRLDIRCIHELVAIFAWLRPFLFTSKDACLFEALALRTFLARFGVHASWVFGVQAKPFLAHCWLQYENCVLNDGVGRVRRYTPIMCIE
ncbi:MAG: lasso peptide biosynthesis B2 protein [Steroidobacteraceae bacterium]|nr:lasso peptide biosynthesis B2 protein [Steroidobacteraceae bacterium]